MSVVIYKIVRQGAMGLKFTGQDGGEFLDPQGLKNPQLARIVGNRLMAYVRCEVGNGVAEVLGEASEGEVAAFNGVGEEEGEGGGYEGGSFKFPG